MRKRFSALIVSLVLVLPSSAHASQTNELIAIAAMPLAVAAVAEITDVPRDDLVAMIATLNQAAVPAPQFIEVVRYAPVALVETREPRFVTYVKREYDRGLVGDALALSIAERYQTYGVEEIRIVDPPEIMVIERQIVPPVVVARFQPVAFDPLALIAMPLAVAAVADITDVPRNDLMSFVASLNRALVPAPQFVEVVRYAPVLLADPATEPQFVTFVTTEVNRGVVGRDLALVIANRFRTAGIDEIDIVAPPTRVIVDRDIVVPAVVVSRVAEVRRHPHGGPPGQLKKEIGVQTGAEVVHGAQPGKGQSRDGLASRGGDRDGKRDRAVAGERDRRVRPTVRQDERRAREPKTRPENKRGRRDREVSKPPAAAQRPSAKSNKGRGSERGGSGGGQSDRGQGKGKGKDKGKG